MIDKIRDWFGLGGFDQYPGGGGHGHEHGGSGGHGHTHGVIDPSIASTERGVWAIKWSFVILEPARISRRLDCLSRYAAMGMGSSAA